MGIYAQHRGLATSSNAPIATPVHPFGIGRLKKGAFMSWAKAVLPPKQRKQQDDRKRNT